MVEKAPVELKKNVDKEEANKILKKLVECGGVIELL